MEHITKLCDILNKDTGIEQSLKFESQNNNTNYSFKSKPPILDVNLLQKHGISQEDYISAQKNELEVFKGEYDDEYEEINY